MNLVSVVVPCYNEEKHIGKLLNALIEQTYPLESIEVLIIDGKSSDKTIDVIDQKSQELKQLNIRVIQNPKKNIPAALNLGIKASTGEIIIRIDAHSIPDPDYIRIAVEDLEKKIAANVGGKWIIIPGGDTRKAVCISKAAAHPFGAGDAKYRYSDTPDFVDTVPYGAFYRTLFDQIGLFNENLLANEDYEFNTRIREAGLQIYFDPRIKTNYVARSTYSDLARQYWRYGYWKVKMLRSFPHTLRWRQAIPPIFVAGLLLLLILAFFIPFVAYLLGFIFITYLLVLIIGSFIFYKRKLDFLSLIEMPIAFIIIHFSWSFGFWYSLLFRMKD